MFQTVFEVFFYLCFYGKRKLSGMKLWSFSFKRDLAFFFVFFKVKVLYYGWVCGLWRILVCIIVIVEGSE